ncbi:hypothetical protein AWZ03_014615 [Drosophila navojoa]|uniref:Uncharacterized protein n=1 Tax=Drosophila navojoa TaxID=7232 RepID=A0A484AQQ0_DRONA|nr:hypothetical protein AWZ03_014615 [Drosophila navojoa]
MPNSLLAMSSSNLAELIANVVQRLILEKNEELKKSPNGQSPAKQLTPDQMQRIMDEVDNRMESSQFNALNWQLAECQGMLEQFEAESTKLREGIKLIRPVLRDMCERMNETSEHAQASGADPVTIDQDAKDFEQLQTSSKP